jgi:hypothetical protein
MPNPTQGAVIRALDNLIARTALRKAAGLPAPASPFIESVSGYDVLGPGGLARRKEQAPVGLADPHREQPAGRAGGNSAGAAPRLPRGLPYKDDDHARFSE